MPLHDYTCNQCSLQFEALVSKKTKDDVACPGCGQHTSRRVSAPATQFTGKGLKTTDYPDVDRVVGADADKRWESIQSRTLAEQKVINDGANAVARVGNKIVGASTEQTKTITSARARVLAVSDTASIPTVQIERQIQGN